MPQPTKRRSARKPKQPTPRQSRSGKARRPIARPPGPPAAASQTFVTRNATALAVAGVVLGAATRRLWLLLPALAAVLFVMDEKRKARR